jgi:hypothetical protein
MTVERFEDMYHTRINLDREVATFVLSGDVDSSIVE